MHNRCVIAKLEKTMDTNIILVDDDGALTESGYAAIQAASAAVKAAKRHPGGREAGWFRLMSRNYYTVDPTRPGMDDADKEKEILEEKAKTLVGRCIEGGALSILEADVRGWPWMIER
jgi:hypothetical protein